MYQTDMHGMNTLRSTCWGGGNTVRPFIIFPSYKVRDSGRNVPVARKKAEGTLTTRKLCMLCMTRRTCEICTHTTVYMACPEAVFQLWRDNGWFNVYSIFRGRCMCSHLVLYPPEVRWYVCTCVSCYDDEGSCSNRCGGISYSFIVNRDVI